MKMLILVKARLTSSGILSGAYLRDLKKRRQLWVLPVAVAGILAGVGTFFFMLFQNYRVILEMGIEAGDPGIIFVISGVFSSVLLFFIGTPLSLSNIFYSSDNKLIVPLPVSRIEIAVSRIFLIYILLLPVHIFINLPALILYFSALGISASGLVSAVSMLLFSPLFPITLALAASALLSSAADLSGHRTGFELAGMAAALLVLGAVQVFLSRSMMGAGTDTARLLFSYIDSLKQVFFAASWRAAGFSPGSLLYAAGGLLFSIASAGAGIFLVNKIFSLNITDRPEGRKKRSSGQTTTALPPSGSPIKALLKREWSIISSSSSFLMETFGEVFILPILLVIFYFTIPAEVSSMVANLSESLPFAPLVVYGALILFGSLNSISSTSISREGKSFLISRSLPVSARFQVKTKWYFHLILFSASWYLNLAILTLFLKIPPVHLIYLIPGGPAAITLIFASNISIDMARPVLGWTHPQQAMKQNMNVLIGMGISILVIAAILLPAAGLYFTGLNILIIGIIIAAGSSVAAAVALKRTFASAESRYLEIAL